MRRFQFVRTYAFLALVAAPLVFGQDAPQAPAINPQSMYWKESAQGVYVRDSAVALEKFAQAERMERLKEWGKAADLYQEVLEKYADRVVPSQVDKDNKIYQYTSVIAAVQEKMSHWPPEGLEVYRTRFEAAAQALLDAAGPDDRSALQGVLSKYYATDTAKLAGMHLMDLYIESGEFPAAAWLGERLLATHPNLIIERPRVMFRTAVADHLAGDDVHAAAIQQELSTRYADETSVIAGQDQKLTDALAAVLAQPAPHAQAIANSDWPMFGGSPSHARVSTAQGRASAKYPASIKLPEVSYTGLNKDQEQQLRTRDHSDADSGAALDIMPAFDHGQLFYQDGARLWAINLSDGQPIADWVKTYPGPGGRAGSYPSSNSNRFAPRGTLQTVTLTDQSVLAVMGAADRFAADTAGIGQSGEPRLVCLNRADGKERWVARPRDLPQEVQALRTAELVGSPLVVDENVYITARSGRGAQFEDCYVLCFSLETGKYKWSSYIASANSVANAMQMDGESATVPDPVPQLAYASGRLYVLTNLGALASLDAYGGRIIWLSIYPRDPSANAAMANPWRFRGNMAGGEANVDKPWMTNPVFVQEGHVFVLPADGQFLQVFDAGSGVEAKRLDPKLLGDADSLLAVDGPWLVLSGKQIATFVNWSRFDPEKSPDADPDALWQENFAGAAEPGSTAIRGRGFVANGIAYFSTLKKLQCVSMKKQRVIAEYPSGLGKSWDSDDMPGAGNVLVSEDHVIVAANRRIDFYTDLSMAKARFERQIAVDPSQPEPWIEYAKMMFSTGDVPAAIERLNGAADRIGGRDHLASGVTRDHLFDTCLDFTKRLGDEIKTTSDPAYTNAVQIYALVAAAADGPNEQVMYRLRRAKLADAVNDSTTSVALYQEIISTPELRDVSVPDDQTNLPTTAAFYSRHAIDAVLSNVGPAAYAQFETASQKKLTDAHDAAALVAVADVYPNSKTAPVALFDAAKMDEANNDHASATQLLRRLYLGYQDLPNQRDVLEAFARNALSLPNRSEVAVARLEDAAKLSGDSKLSKPLPLPGGGTVADVTLAQAVVELKKARLLEQTQKLPNFNLPVGPFPQGKRPASLAISDGSIDNVTALLAPSAANRRVDRVTLWSTGTGASWYAPGANKPLGTIQLAQAPTGVAWTPAGPLLWGGSLATFAHDDASQPAWQFDLSAAPALAALGSDGPTDDAPADGDAPNNGTASVVMNNGQVIRVRGNANARFVVNGRIVNIRNGRVVAPNDDANKKAAPRAKGLESIVDGQPLGDAIVLSTSAGRVIVLDSATGNLRWQNRAADGSLDRILANEDFVVTFKHDDSSAVITAFDTFTGQIIGRHVFDDANRLPTNIALGGDGTMAYTLPDRLVLKNLFQPWSNSDREIAATAGDDNNQNAATYATCNLPGELLVVEGRVLVLADQNVSMRVYDVSSGKPIRYTPVGSDKEVDLVLPTLAHQAANVDIRLVGSHVYLVGVQSLVSYNLDHLEQSWQMPPGMPAREQITDSFIGQDYLVLLSDTTARVNAGKVAEYRLRAFNRQPVGPDDPEENGSQTFNEKVADATGITDVQPTEGGFVYRSADGKVRWLRGTR